MHTRLVYCTVHTKVFVCAWERLASDCIKRCQYQQIKPKLAWLEFQYFGIILKLALLQFRYFGIISKLAWLEFQYFGIQKITENNFSISVYRYSNIDIPNPATILIQTMSNQPIIKNYPLLRT